MKMKWTILETDNGMMLRDYLIHTLQFSSRLVKKVKSTEGRILINGEPKTVRYLLKTGDTLEVHFPQEKRSASVLAENIPLDIVYEDEHILVVNKNAKMPTIPSKLHPNGTLANGILFYYDEQNIPFTVHVVTRLDKDTSGLVLIAKHQYAHSVLSDLQRVNEIERTYIAIVHGRLQKKEGTIDLPIARNPHSIIERIVSHSGKKAVTHYKVLEEVEEYSVVQIRLETGRTHQIRVHFSHIGHPLVGDDLYGGKLEQIKRQALHCASIRFVHPFTKKEMVFSSKMPEDMNLLLN